MKLHLLFKSQIYLNRIRTYSVHFIFLLSHNVGHRNRNQSVTRDKLPDSGVIHCRYVSRLWGSHLSFKFMHLLPLNMSTSFSKELLRRNDRNCELFVRMKPSVRNQIDGRVDTAGNILSPTINLFCNYWQSEYPKSFWIFTHWSKVTPCKEYLIEHIIVVQLVKKFQFLWNAKTHCCGKTSAPPHYISIHISPPSSLNLALITLHAAPPSIKGLLHFSLSNHNSVCIYNYRIYAAAPPVSFSLILSL